MKPGKLNRALLFCLMISVTFSYPAYSDSQEYHFQQLGIEDGLSQSTVLCSLQDSRGYMWFATRSGLNRFDGYRFVVYLNDPKDPASLSDDGVNSIYEDKDGTIWVGTINGHLNKFNRLTETFTHKNIISMLDVVSEQGDEFYEYPLSFSRNQSTSITSITEDNDGNIWVATWGKGILKLNKNFVKLNHFYTGGEVSNGLPTNRIMDLLFDRDGKLWIATFGGGLCRLNLSENKGEKDYLFENFPAGGDDFSLSDSKLLRLFQDSYGNMWIGSFYGGINFIAENQITLSPGKIIINKYSCPATDRDLTSNTVMSITEDQDKSIWLGTFGGGLIKFDRSAGKSRHFLNDPFNTNSLGDNDVLSLCVDKSGIIWAGSHLGSGITKIQSSHTKFRHIKNEPGKSNSLNDNVVWAIYQDSQDVIWIGTYRGGVNKFDYRSNRFSFIRESPNQNSLSSDHIRSIKEDAYGNLWIGTYDGGLNIFNKGSNEIRVYKNSPDDPQSIGGNQIQDIFIENDSTYWIAVFGGGLNKVTVRGNPFNRSLKFIKYRFSADDPSTISDNRVYKIFKSRDGVFWIGTYGGGLNSFNRGSGKFTRYAVSSQGKDNFDIKNLMTISEDTNGMIWFGAYGGGLTSFDRSQNKFTRYSKEEGITSSVIYGILEDENKNLWISSDDGLFKFNLMTGEVKRFDIQDGVQSLEFSGGAYFKNNRNEMFFGGINGFNIFNPLEINTNKFSPPVVVTSIRVFDEYFKGEPEVIILDYKKNFLTFEFASLDFSDPLDNQYYFKLEGLQDEWQFADASARIASYTNLSPGTYIFKVRGSNSDGIWSNNNASVKIVILSPFWQKWWFIALVVILIAWVIYYISTLRIKNLLAIEKLKSQLAADLHDNVGSGLTEISILSEVASRKIPAGGSSSSTELGKISDISRQLVDNMSDIVWVINPNRDSLHDLIVRLKNSYGEVLEPLGILLRVSDLDKIKDIKLPMDFKQNIYSILKEAINNSIRHSGCGNINLQANFRGDVIEISVEDDGKGFNEHKIEYGNGLINMERRAEQIGGKIKIKSNETGTIIRFVGRLGRIKKLKSLISR